MTIDELLEEFRELDDWDDRCDLLIDLGFELPDFPEDARTEENRVHGCMSQVWMVARLLPEQDSLIEILADSDSVLVKGLIYILLTLFSGKTAEQILATDAKAAFGEIGLDQHLSTQRKNGLNGMVQRIREFAAGAQT
ncbi:MAG: cysteine desulfuration protein SufE [Planctomycetaceae bacterium]|nr:cysteine desulfuration protein SufE [Planctomycetaceae bacterium]